MQAPIDTGLTQTKAGTVIRSGCHSGFGAECGGDSRLHINDRNEELTSHLVPDRIALIYPARRRQAKHGRKS